MKGSMEIWAKMHFQFSSYIFSINNICSLVEGKDVACVVIQITIAGLVEPLCV